MPCTKCACVLTQSLACKPHSCGSWHFVHVSPVGYAVGYVSPVGYAVGYVSPVGYAMSLLLGALLSRFVGTPGLNAREARLGTTDASGGCQPQAARNACLTSMPAPACACLSNCLPSTCTISSLPCFCPLVFRSPLSAAAIARQSLPLSVCAVYVCLPLSTLVYLGLSGYQASPALLSSTPVN